MNNQIFAFLLIIGFLSCNNVNMDKTERNGEPNIYRTVDSDQKMNLAIKTAQSTLDQFDKALRNKDYDSGTVALKIKFPTKTGFEHIWATEIILDSDSYYGVIDNLPYNAKDIKLGEKIKIHNEDISDWMFGRNGKLVGGFTIRVIRDRLTGQAKKDFDKDFKLKIDE